MDYTKLTDDQLKNVINNHRNKGATGLDSYGQAMTEFHRRHAPKLDIDKSLRAIYAAASGGRFISYGDLAAANGANWNEVRYPMNDHLWVLVDHAHRKGWPMLSAIVVNKDNIASGDMDPGTLAGFVRAATELGHSVTDPRGFLVSQQAACFQWGKKQNVL